MNYKNKPILNSFPLLKRKEATKSGFTLVELIVVITILAILGTIAFISMEGYSKSSRDSVRISDVSNMKTSLELFHLNAGKYPLPDNNEIVDYGGETLWYQGTFGATVVSNLSRNLNEIPTDPLSDKEYIFSVTNNRNEFQILSLLEGDLSLNSIQKTNAANLTLTPRIDGTYNGVFITTEGYIVPTPSIVTSEDISLGAGMTLDGTNIKSQVTNLGKNIPNIGNVVSNTGGLDIALSVYTGSITSKSSNADKASVMQAIQGAYTGSSLANSDIYKYILSVSGETELAALLDTVVLKGAKTVTSSNSDTTPDTTSTGLISSTDCTDAGWYWVDSASDVYIGATQGNGFCISPRFGDWNSNSNLGNGGISWNGWGNRVADDYNGWDSDPINDAGDLGPGFGQTRKLDSQVSYDCLSLGSATDVIGSDNIVGRMKWLATTGNDYNQARSIDWITGLVPHTVGTYPHAIPALYIADCIDGVKDLTTDMDYKHYPDEGLNETITYSAYNTDVTIAITSAITLSNVTYQNRQKYLTAWTQKSGSHLPSAFSYINNGTAGGELESLSSTNWDKYSNTSPARGEYQVACDNSLLTDIGSSTDAIWLSAIGNTTGATWGRSARTLSNCDNQDFNNTGTRYGNYSARFVVRP